MNFNRLQMEAKTPQRYIAISMAWVLEDTGILDIEDMKRAFCEGEDELFAEKFGRIPEEKLNELLANVFLA